MKRTVSILLIFLTLTVAAQHQQLPAAASTRIIGKMPAKDQPQLDSCMQQITKLGQQGITSMAMLLATYQGNSRVRLQYALSGYAAYVTTAGKETERSKAIKAYCTALKQLPRTDDKLFIINQLQRFADNSAVPGLKAYLLSQQLGEATTATLAQINTPDAIVALLKALDKANGKSEIGLITALGRTHYLSALDAITLRALSTDTRVRKAAYYALAEIGNAESEPLLSAAAEKAGYHYDATGATGAYLLYIKRLADNWPVAPAITAANKLLQRCHTDDLVHVRIAALKVIAGVKGADASPLLMMEADDKNAVYRAAVLEMAGRIMNAANTDQWIAKARIAKGTVKAEIITMMGNSRQRTVIPLLREALKNEEQNVRLSAIHATAHLESGDLMPDLMIMMKTADTTEIKAIAETIQYFKGRDMSDRIATAMLQQPPFAQILLLHLLEKKMAADRAPQIRFLLKSKDPAVVQAATATLKALNISTE